MRILLKTSEFKRIVNLPMRILSKKDLTPFFKKQNGTMQLNAIQNAMLHDLMQPHATGAVGAVAVGAGKSLISLLAPLAMQSHRPLLIVPAELRNQTLKYVIPAMSKHWLLHKELKIVSYAYISRLSGFTFLDEYKPDLIICDESHRLKSKKSARTRRFFRFFEKNPATKLLLLSGTITNNSLLDYYHLSSLALRQGSPIPRDFREAETWDLALSPQKIEFVKDNALLTLIKKGDTKREKFKNRLRLTRGFVVSDYIDCPAAIYIKKIQLQFTNINRVVTEIIKTEKRPDDLELFDHLAVHRTAKQASQGFFYKWKIEPPGEWKIARSAYVAVVRDFIARNKSNIDTELQYRLQVDCQYKNKWLEIKDTFKPENIVVWFSEELIHFVMNWIKENEPAIVWVSDKPVGDILQKKGVIYYPAGDDKILDESGKRTVAASLRSHGTGKNLQMFNSALVLNCPSSGLVWEQMLGRMHRQGQKEDEVWTYVLIHNFLQKNSLHKALESARYLDETLSESRLMKATLIGD